MVITLYSGIGCNCAERQGKPSLCPSECQQLSIVGSSIQKRVKMDYYERTQQRNTQSLMSYFFIISKKSERDSCLLEDRHRAVCVVMQGFIYHYEMCLYCLITRKIWTGSTSSHEYMSLPRTTLTLSRVGAQPTAVNTFRTDLGEVSELTLNYTVYSNSLFKHV